MKNVDCKITFRRNCIFRVINSFSFRFNSTITYYCINCNLVSVLAPIFKGNDKRNTEKHHGSAQSSLRRSLSMDSLDVHQNRCQLCLFSRYDLHPAKKISDEKLQYQSKKSVINNYPTLFKSPAGARCIQQNFKLPHRCSKINSQDDSVISCNICGVCKQNQVSENSGRFTITRNSKKPDLKSTSRKSEDLSSSGVLIAVEDWTETLKRNQFSKSASMQDNYYENLKQLDNASSNNNNNNPPYENSAIIQKLQKEAVDMNRNKSEPLYAVVNKNSKTKNEDFETCSNIINNNQLKTSSKIQNIPCMTGSTPVEAYSKVWKGPKKESNSKEPRMWACKCSYAYNPLYVDNCDICDSPRISPQAMKLITLTKNNSTENQSGSSTKDNVNNNPPKLVMSKSTHGFDELPNVRVPIASFDQDLEDDFQFLPADSPTSEETFKQQWTCYKCTLVNSASVTACIVCGGSKLKSSLGAEDMTLRKGEFWTCGQCTLKNSLGTNLCSACKAIRQIPSVTKPPNFRPYTSSSSSPASTPTTPGTSKPPDQPAGRSQLLVPSSRASRSPSPRHDRSGAIPKRHSTGSVLTRSGSGHGNHSTPIVLAKPQLSTVTPVSKIWQCPACTFENPAASVVCEICSSHRKAAVTSSEGPPIILNVPGLEDSRHESKLMENLRQQEETEALSKWENIIQYCKENNEIFVDDSFPPAAKSLYYNPNSTSISESNPVVQWRRPKDINCDGGNFPWSVFRTPLPSDICQGKIL